MVQSVHLSVTSFSLCPPYDIIMKFPGVITNDRCEVHAKGQRSKVKFTEFKTQHNGDEMMHKAWCCLGEARYWFFFNVIRQISRSHAQKILDFDPNRAFPDCYSPLIHWWLWNDAQSLKQYKRVALLFSRSSVKFQGHTGQKITDFDSIEHNFKVTRAEKLTISIQFQRFRMIVFKVFHSISTLNVIQAIYKVTRPAAAIKSLGCALSSIQSDFM